MKICFAVCEYNPLHNGHLKHLAAIRREIAPDCIAVIQSGNFTQRGEIALLNKHTRAKHAILAGADIVFELPAVFAIAPAEVFATGAVKLLASVKGEKFLCFGTESGDKTSILSTAGALSEESKEFRSIMKEELKKGISQIRAKVNALQRLNTENVDFGLLKSPNNILGIEYAKAILKLSPETEIFPIRREGAGYHDKTIGNGDSSASAIREAILRGEKESVRTSVPPYVFDDLPDKLPDIGGYELFSAVVKDKKEIAKTLDCTEGLENRIKAFALHSHSYNELTEKLQTKRYTCTRLNRILLSSALGIEKTLVRKCLKNPSYLKVLAVKKERKDLLPYFAQNSSYPLVLRRTDISKLEGAAEKSFEKDLLLNSVYNFIAGTSIAPTDMIKV